MKVEMIKEGPIDGEMKIPGDVIDVEGALGSRLIEFGFAREAKSGVKTAEKKDPEVKTADKTPDRNAEKKTGSRKAKKEDHADTEEEEKGSED
jgi:hypothetical protein